MEIKIKYPVEEKYVPVAYYLGWVVEGVAEIKEIKEVDKHWEIEIYDKEGASFGEFSCPFEWISGKEIITADGYIEWINRNRKSHGKKLLGFDRKSQIRKDFNSGRKSRDSELKPFFDYIRSYLYDEKESGSKGTQKLELLFRNLPPLKSEK